MTCCMPILADACCITPPYWTKRPRLMSWWSSMRSKSSQAYSTKCIASSSAAGSVSYLPGAVRASCGAAAPTCWPGAHFKHLYFQIAELYGGSLTFASVPGQGTRFSLKLPRS